ncbi:MAG: hypothetical protein V4507_10685 [Verrucomicrobiota bacterium]
MNKIGKCTLMALALGTITAVSSQAAWVETTKGPRLTTSQSIHSTGLKGDSVSIAHCPMMTKKAVTYISSVDSKGRIQRTSTGTEYVGPCGTQLIRTANKEVKNVMVCDQTTAVPVACSKMSVH